jgi:hypothetical protein
MWKGTLIMKTYLVALVVMSSIGCVHAPEPNTPVGNYQENAPPQTQAQTPAPAPTEDVKGTILEMLPHPDTTPAPATKP